MSLEVFSQKIQSEETVYFGGPKGGETRSMQRQKEAKSH